MYGKVSSRLTFENFLPASEIGISDAVKANSTI